MTREEQVNLLKRSVQEWNNYWYSCDDNYANLIDANLMGANLSGANLRSANLRSADLSDAYLIDANLSGANLSDHVKIISLIARACRSDDYMFLAFKTSDGLIIKAGCRLLSPTEYRAHVEKEYPDTPKAKETLRIIKYLEDCAEY